MTSFYNNFKQHFVFLHIWTFHYLFFMVYQNNIYMEYIIV